MLSAQLMVCSNSSADGECFLRSFNRQFNVKPTVTRLQFTIGIRPSRFLTAKTCMVSGAGCDAGAGCSSEAGAPPDSTAAV
jgi:hypothetical protein